jgi:hypothetical protein
VKRVFPIVSDSERRVKPRAHSNGGQWSVAGLDSRRDFVLLLGVALVKKFGIGWYENWNIDSMFSVTMLFVEWTKY